MNAHQLAEILLNGEDIPVVIPATNKKNSAEAIENIYVIEDVNSPFEQCVLLEGLISLEKDGLINLD